MFKAKPKGQGLIPYMLIMLFPLLVGIFIVVYVGNSMPDSRAATAMHNAGYSNTTVNARSVVIFGTPECAFGTIKEFSVTSLAQNGALVDATICSTFTKDTLLLKIH